MKFSRYASAFLLGLGIAAAGSGPARSAEQLVMPFACDARGGGVRLSPAPEQAYRIYGKREKWLFRYCSPNAPDRCHHWMLHQFDVDCGGIRVPWIRVAEASSPDGRAWVEDGRMTLKLGPAEASAREERMARRRWWWRHRGAYPADERERFDGPTGPHSEMVELPAGFAPVLGTRAQFVGAPPGDMATAPPEGGSDVIAKAPPKPQAPAPQKREAQPAATPKETAAQPVKPPAPTPAKREAAKAAAPLETKEPKSSVSEKAVPSPAKEEKAAASTQTAPETSGGTSVAPIIINRPKDSGAPAAGASTVAGAPTAAEKSADVTAATSQTVAPTTSAPTAEGDKLETVPAQGTSPIATGSLQDEGGQAVLRAQTLTIGFVLFGVLAASSFVLWSRRQERARLGTIVRRDIANVSFGGTAPSPGLPAPHAPHQPPAPTQVAAAEPTSVGLEMPSTPAEALQVLGASPDASLDVIKKIVDGLRQSWHPDFAKSDDDRLYREQRIKQINVAWDILSGRRNAA